MRRFKYRQITEFRERQGWDMTRLGVELYRTGFAKNPIPSSHIGRYESGQCRPNGATLTGLIVLTGIPAADWWTEPELTAAA